MATQARAKSIAEVAPDTKAVSIKPPLDAKNHIPPARITRTITRRPEASADSVPVLAAETDEAPALSVAVMPATPILDEQPPVEPTIFTPAVPEMLVMDGQEDEVATPATEALDATQPEFSFSGDVIGSGEELDQSGYTVELPLKTRLELSLFDNLPAADQPEEVAGAEVSFDIETLEEQPDLAALLQSMEPERAEAAQPVLSVIARIARQIQELPVTSNGEDMAAETEKLVMEQALEQWCARLLECLDIDADAETVRQFAKFMVSHEPAQAAGEGQLYATTLQDEGTHERKAADGLAALSRLAHDIKQKLHLPLWLGRYTLRVAIA